MPTKKNQKDKITVKQFKDGRMDWWVNMKHYTIQDNKPFLVAGGIEEKEETEHFRKYLKRKKLI